MSVIIYTDGSAKGNPGNGGYGVVMISGGHRKELSGGQAGAPSLLVGHFHFQLENELRRLTLAGDK